MEFQTQSLEFVRDFSFHIHQKMLSGIKIIPSDQLKTGDFGEETMNSTKEKRERKKKKERRRKEREYSLDSHDGSDSLASGSESEEERRLTRKRKGRRKERAFKGSTSSSSDDEHEKRKERKDRKELSDDDGRDLLPQSDKELARKEMGLEWMLRSGRTFGSNAVKNDTEEEPHVEEVKKTNPRELNPYLIDSGSGYPDDASPSEAGTGQLLSSSVVGDGGASWRLKALERAKEQAAREGRKLDEVVEERWGSLGPLAASVATRRAAASHAHLHAIKDRRRGQLENSEFVAGDEVKGGTKEVQHAHRDYLRDISSRHPEMRKPKQDSLHWKKNKKQNISSEDSSLISAVISGINKFSNDGSFMESISRHEKKDLVVCSSSHTSKEEVKDLKENDIGSSRVTNSQEVSSLTQGLSANQLAAKVLQLRMKGRHEEAEQLSREMETMIDKPDTINKVVRQGTDLNTGRYFEKKISSEQKRREEDSDLHLAQTIMRNKQYSMAGRADDEYDYDGDAPSKKRNHKREGMHEVKQNIPKRILTQQERCQFCFENPSRPKHLIVSVGNFTYMMLPQLQPVVQGHCCILPMQHETSTRTVDKNVWEEIHNFKKCLLRMFAAEDKDVVFIETVINLSRQRRHCLINCIPIPYVVAKQAPGYFKKAIDEAEDESGQHEMKKVIPTSGNLRNMIPENLAYFHVEFGLDRGFAHVIDDDTNFPSSFGLNVIRGMLRLPVEDMHRRQQQEPIEKQKQAVASFAKEWEPFDWTKDLD